jgi:hypothetical protein
MLFRFQDNDAGAFSKSKPGSPQIKGTRDLLNASHTHLFETRLNQGMRIWFDRSGDHQIAETLLNPRCSERNGISSRGAGGDHIPALPLQTKSVRDKIIDHIRSHGTVFIKKWLGRTESTTDSLRIHALDGFAGPETSVNESFGGGKQRQFAGAG